MGTPVVLSGWEIDCCVGLPDVGGEVEWRLAWRDFPTEAGATDVDWHTERVALGKDHSYETGVTEGLLLTSEGVSAWWPGTDPRAVPRRGFLNVEAHVGVPTVIPATRGRVRELSLLVWTMHNPDGQVWRPIPDRTTAWPMADGASWQDRESYAALGGDLAAGLMRSAGAVLLVLDVPPPGTQPRCGDHARP